MQSEFQGKRPDKCIFAALRLTISWQITVTSLFMKQEDLREKRILSKNLRPSVELLSHCWIKNKRQRCRKILVSTYNAPMLQINMVPYILYKENPV